VIKKAIEQVEWVHSSNGGLSRRGDLAPKHLLWGCPTLARASQRMKCFSAARIS